MQIALTLVGPDSDAALQAVALVTPALAGAHARVKEPRILGDGAVDLLVVAPDLEQRLAALCALWCVPLQERLTDQHAVSHIDERFHIDLMEASGNLEMARIHRDITDRIRIVRRLEFTRNYRIDVTYDEHSRILRALLQHDGLQAKVLLQKHIRVSRDEVKNITLHTLQNAKPKRVETTA